LPDLLFAVLSRIVRIEFQSINPVVNNSRQTVARLLAVSREQVRTHVLRNSREVAALAACYGQDREGVYRRSHLLGVIGRLSERNVKPHPVLHEWRSLSGSIPCYF